MVNFRFDLVIVLWVKVVSTVVTCVHHYTSPIYENAYWLSQQAGKSTLSHLDNFVEPYTD